MGPDTIELEITDLLRVGDCCNSQLLTVQELRETSHSGQPSLSKTIFPRRSSPALDTKLLVAKVYDPLYYDDAEYYINPFLAMNQNYTHEVRSYHHLSELQGDRIPRYYGSYSLDIPISHAHQSKDTTQPVPVRSVRMILVEQIAGTDMQSVESARLFSSSSFQQVRQQIMKDVIELESLIYFKDIFLRDCCPRNMILSTPNEDGQTPHVVFIDFCHALFNRRPDDEVALSINFFVGQ
ncbi:hypothetical protein NUU61_004917 [Penicillium alfredii]|uniref:Protein kinase domain-containing protein n=1 Tax=Penicillium alfredii TaxID=1506179 RepID=A0A9W9F8K5_9EURO|nr:uncharacterized protein NUU61_004917 [Penicillium alfredii]KAJ5095561.1 hypothetical protein NUU61_004917 [Penicillium alfredii]